MVRSACGSSEKKLKSFVGDAYEIYSNITSRTFKKYLHGKYEHQSFALEFITMSFKVFLPTLNLLEISLLNPQFEIKNKSVF